MPAWNTPDLGNINMRANERVIQCTSQLMSCVPFCFFELRPLLFLPLLFLRRQPELLEPWWEEMLDAARQPACDAIRRNVARYFSELRLELPVELETSLVALFTNWTCEPTTPVAIQVNAMQFVADPAERFAKQAARVKAFIESQVDSGSAGFRSRGNRVLQQLAK